MEDGTFEFYHETMDVHSYSRPDRARVRHLDLDLKVQFDSKTIEGVATVHSIVFLRDELVLDTRGLIDSLGRKRRRIRAWAGRSDLRRAPHDPAERRRSVRIHYTTSPSASALQWLDPAQTAGKAHPFLYTQSQAIHARSWIPLQDTSRRARHLHGASGDSAGNPRGDERSRTAGRRLPARPPRCRRT